MGRLLPAAICVVLASALACDGDDGGGADGGADGPESACQDRAAACVTDANAAEVTGQCTFDDTARECILDAETCAQVHACYMGPLPDGSTTTFCAAACERCGLSCDAECTAGDPCVAAAGTCDALGDCLDGG